jgi:hypothetical protein
VKLGIEVLESRESPSAFQPDSLPVSPFVEPLALAPAATDPVLQGITVSPAALPQQLVSASAGASAYPASPFGVSGVANPLGIGNGSTLPFANPGFYHQQDGPVITEFHASEGEGGWWTFSGVVVADNPWGLTVRFGGLSSLQGQTTDVQGDGTFQLTIRLQNGEEGLATAQTTDWQGRDSNLAQDYVHQSNGVISMH